ncbi:hypothetical protein RF11_01742 [Thelohanellus kitauei]|uniref:Uncharacterized protein n=1 Tax=Thelohanellus kitauei TaxID=669202 RepID=A0A0C2M1T3_THEKT|nr:hypothetical protein RF11_01742 [Thelohanellus kitauei]
MSYKSSRVFFGLPTSHVNRERGCSSTPNHCTWPTCADQEGYSTRHKTQKANPLGCQGATKLSSKLDDTSQMGERESKKRRRRTRGTQKPQRTVADQIGLSLAKCATTGGSKTPGVKVKRCGFKSYCLKYQIGLQTARRLAIHHETDDKYRILFVLTASISLD